MRLSIIKGLKATELPNGQFIHEQIKEAHVFNSVKTENAFLRKGDLFKVTTTDKDFYLPMEQAEKLADGVLEYFDLKDENVNNDIKNIVINGLVNACVVERPKQANEEKGE